MHRSRPWAPLALFASACAVHPPPPLEPSSDTLTAAELAGTYATSVYDAVRRLRPSFLRARGPTSVLIPGTEGPAVWIDDAHIGDVAELRDVPTGDVVSIRYLPSWEASTRYGPGYPNGVLVVTTRP